jgi:hypothetical protein
MNEYKYILEKGSKKHLCPECNKKSFVRYINTETGEYLPIQYGRCDRESKCNYHNNPYLDGYAKENRVNKVNFVSLKTKKFFKPPPKKEPEHEHVFFDFDTYKETLNPEKYNCNTFIQNLLNNVPFPFDVNDVTSAIKLYRLGTVANGYRTGAITFPFIDINNNIRTVQVKQFNKENNTTGTDFLHSIIEKHHTRNSKPLPKWLQDYVKQDKRITCLFGEHLLSKYPNNPVALVEAPKTAVYGSLYFGLPETPESLIWLAVYNKSSFTFDKLKALKGRFVYVFPDLSKDGNTFKEWESKAKEYESRLSGTRFIFSDLLEQLAPEQDKVNGGDIADYLIKQDWRLFKGQNQKHSKNTQKTAINKEQPPQLEPKKVSLVNKVSHEKNTFQTPPQKKQQNWDKQILELETFFKNTELPTEPTKLNKWTTILNCEIFIQSNLQTAKANNGNYTYEPYLNQLQELKDFLTINLN